LSKHLGENGWDPYILTTNSAGPLPVELNHDHIFRVGDNTQAGAAVGTQNKNIFSKLKGVRSKLGLASRLMDRIWFTWYRPIKKLDLGVFKEAGFDLIIASYGPGAALFVGRFLSRKLRVPWIADFRDLAALHTDKWNGRNAAMRYVDSAIERWLLKKASALTTVSAGLQKALAAAHRLPTHVVYNGWEPSQHNAATPPVRHDACPYIYYAGRFYTHRLESIFMLVRALSRSDMVLKIRSLGPLDIEKKIADFSEECDVAAQVEILPPADPEVVDRESHAAAINLVVEDLDKSDDWKKGTLTGKFLPMLNLKPAILAIARDDSEIGEILDATRKGKLCFTPDQVVEYLNGGYLPFMGAGNENVLMYSKRMQAKLLADALDKVCGA